MYINTYNTVAQEGINYLKRKGYKLDQSDQPDGLLMRSQVIHDMEFPNSLLAIGRAGAGVNNIPVDRCSNEGIIVFNAPGANSNAVKEITIAMMINLSRNIFPSVTWTRGLTGPDQDVQVEEGKKQFRGSELIGKTLGVIGLGNVGSKVANAGVDLGMEVIGYDPYIKMKNAWEVDSAVRKVEDITDLFRYADYITIHTPATDETENMLDASAFEKMKKGVTVINFAREEVCDTDAVKEYIDNGKIKAFATDFRIPSLDGYENVLTTPHIGGTTGPAEAQCAMMAAQELDKFLKTGEITNSVNFPNVELSFNSPYRLSIINRNIPNMVGLMSTGLAAHQMNIANIINKSAGDYAYTLIDIDNTDETLLNQVITDLNKIEGIVRVRLIKNNQDNL
ncbi:hypothetical protein AWM75_01720 [Aerococcus urinaehominis]|uniref:D-3-phosphoglycerate dehydrogenase n=1 Tax=Aerococcus urinaehominis TaxID=128944 RepID=A0A0X8FK57_9LACT|nr:3-phosphoglycerate dehydrogenase family protein [Aerococcus urinaehominis]AMB98789.1 hypothetical protein AWM75_01720 [Aerococcus urinaehominis]SDM12583.1 D-3-phosphoglycerate dehydrogenase [Aerococcus urinaehominis]